MCEANAAGVKHCKVLNIELFWHVRTSTLRGRPETSTMLYMAWLNPAAARVQAGPAGPPWDAPGRRRRPRYVFKMGGGPPLGTRTPDRHAIITPTTQCFDTVFDTFTHS